MFENKKTTEEPNTIEILTERYSRMRVENIRALMEHHESQLVRAGIAADVHAVSYHRESIIALQAALVKQSSKKMV